MTQYKILVKRCWLENGIHKQYTHIFFAVLYNDWIQVDIYGSLFDTWLDLIFTVSGQNLLETELKTTGSHLLIVNGFKLWNKIPVSNFPQPVAKMHGSTYFNVIKAAGKGMLGYYSLLAGVSPMKHLYLKTRFYRDLNRLKSNEESNQVSRTWMNILLTGL